MAKCKPRKVRAEKIELSVNNSSQEAEKYTLEQQILRESTTNLVSVIAINPLHFSYKLLEKGMIPQSLVREMTEKEKDKTEKATELVLRVIEKVGSSPETFGTFLGILQKGFHSEVAQELKEKLSAQVGSCILLYPWLKL